jgi:hypothetical protein
MRVAAERGIRYPRTLHFTGRLGASMELWRLSKALTQTIGGAIVLWIMATSRTKFGLRKKDFVKQKVLVSAWTRSVSRECLGNEGPPRTCQRMPRSALEGGGRIRHPIAEGAVA